MPVGLGPVGKGYSESMVPLGIGERVKTGGARYRQAFLFLPLTLARGSRLSDPERIMPYRSQISINALHRAFTCRALLWSVIHSPHI